MGRPSGGTVAKARTHFKTRKAPCASPYQSQKEFIELCSPVCEPFFEMAHQTKKTHGSAVTFNEQITKIPQYFFDHVNEEKGSGMHHKRSIRFRQAVKGEFISEFTI
jgi:hypothetical protein